MDQSALDLDLINGKIYWTDDGSGVGENDSIMRGDLDGSGTAEEIFTAGLITPAGIALDEANGELYWSDTSGDFVERGDVVALTSSPILTGQPSPMDIEFVMVTTPTPSYDISGTIYDDVDGDGDVFDDNVKVVGATVYLYVDAGIVGEIDVADALVRTTTTDAGGSYSFTGLGDSIYWVVVDSTTIDPDAGFNGGFSSGDAWAEQTYGVAGSVTFAGSYSYAATAGALYGGMQSGTSDNAAALTTAEHVTRVIVLGSDVTNVDSGFSFNVITNTGDDGAATGRSVQGSLRQFILNSNAIENALYGPNTSQFAIPTSDNNYDGSGNGEFTITPATALPTITDTIVLDGTTQAGFAGTPIIELTGISAGAGADGLVVRSGGDGSTIRGLVINQFDNAGIYLNLANSITIEGNFIGTDVTGTLDRGNLEDGISVDDSDNIQIGGTTAAARNIISWNDGNGVHLFNGVDNAVIEGNYIGTDVAGLNPAGNTLDGVRIADNESDGNRIGGATPGAGNLISGNTGWGVRLVSADFTEIYGNFIGLDVRGNALGNGGGGIRTELLSTDNKIGGTNPGEANVIAFNTFDGVHVETERNEIRTNEIFGNASLNEIHLVPSSAIPRRINRPFLPQPLAAELPR